MAAATETRRGLRVFPRVRRAVEPIAEARGLARAMLWIGALVTGFFVVLAAFAFAISPYHFDQYQAHGKRFAQLAHPSSAHLMGTTVQSTDVLSRVVYGAQTELEVVALALVFGLAVGVPLGLISGYFAGPLDRVLVLIMDALFAFP